ncbi:MAG TPA: ankyrin repeat domain-containing protein [Myxococcota bacterium]|nr:ankyrin repeat domain-containing protein [Myxococcota bacterium]
MKSALSLMVVFLCATGKASDRRKGYVTLPQEESPASEIEIAFPKELQKQLSKADYTFGNLLSSFNRPLTDIELDFIEDQLIDGADVEEKDEKSGLTPLMAAVRNGDLGLTRMLLDYGADAKAINDDKCVMDYAGVDPDMIQAISLATESLMTLLNTICEKMFFRRLIDWELLAAEFLLRKGASANEANSSGTTPLMIAAYTADEELIKILLKYGAKNDMKDRRGCSPMDFAKNNEHIKNLLSGHH